MLRIFSLHSLAGASKRRGQIYKLRQLVVNLEGPRSVEYVRGGLEVGVNLAVGTMIGRREHVLILLNGFKRMG